MAKAAEHAQVLLPAGTEQASAGAEAALEHQLSLHSLTSVLACCSKPM